MANNDSSLMDLRQSIDAIDRQLVALLTERLGYVRQVGEYKQAHCDGKKSFMRSGREAVMMRDLVAKTVDYPPAAIVGIWRQIISASINLEQSMSAICDVSQSDDCYWLAREYFGGFIDLAKTKQEASIVQEVVSGKSRIAVVPFGQGQWWNDLAKMEGKHGLAVFAGLPFIGDEPFPQALALACIDPEPSGDDCSLWVMNGTKHELEQFIARAQSQHVAIRCLEQQQSSFLLHVDGFYPSLECDLAFWQAIGANDCVVPIGVYARAIKS